LIADGRYNYELIKVRVSISYNNKLANIQNQFMAFTFHTFHKIYLGYNAYKE